MINNNTFNPYCDIQYTVYQKPIIALEEKDTKITFLNDARLNYREVRIPKSETIERADFLLEKCDAGQIIIELKGSNIEKAASQIDSTNDYLKNTPKYKDATYFLIVSSNIPKRNFEKTKESWKTKYKINIKVIGNNKKVKFEDFVK